jgi:heme a synthase
MQDALGIFHATLAQLFFALVGVIAVITSRWWSQADFSAWKRFGIGAVRWGFTLVTLLILVQLVVAATMRHQHAGLAISDFPLAHGKVWPDTDETSVARYNQQRGEVHALNPITPAQVQLQMAHRILALLLILGVAWMAGATLKRVGTGAAPGRLAVLWLGLLFIQVVLGAATIWTNKAADIATAHVAVGALCFVTGVGLTLLSWRCERSKVLQRDSSLTTRSIGFDAHSVKVSA